MSMNKSKGGLEITFLFKIMQSFVQNLPKLQEHIDWEHKELIIKTQVFSISYIYSNNPNIYTNHMKAFIK